MYPRVLQAQNLLYNKRGLPRRPVHPSRRDPSSSGSPAGMIVVEPGYFWWAIQRHRQNCGRNPIIAHACRVLHTYRGELRLRDAIQRRWSRIDFFPLVSTRTKASRGQNDARLVGFIRYVGKLDLGCCKQQHPGGGDRSSL